MGNPAPKLNPSIHPHLPLLQVLKYFSDNPASRKDLKQIKDAVNSLYAEEHSEKVIRVALGHLVESGYLLFTTEDKNRHVYYFNTAEHWKGETNDEYEIVVMHLLQDFGIALYDYGNATASIVKQLLRLKTREHNTFSELASELAKLSIPFMHIPDYKDRANIVLAIKNHGKNVVLTTFDGRQMEARVGGLCLRRGNFFVSFVDDGHVFGLYINQIDTIKPVEAGLRLEFSYSVKMALFSLTTCAFDGELLMEGTDFRLEVHPSAVQYIVYGRPQSEVFEYVGKANDGWLVYDYYDDIRQELVDLLAGSVGRVRIMGPEGLRELVADRIHEIASIIG